MAAPPSPSPPAGRGGFERGGLSGRERWLIAAILFAGVVLAGLLIFAVPLLLVSEQDYRCSPTSLSASCLGPAGADGIDDQALSQARAAARTSFGVLSAGLLAGAAAAIGVVISNHNAALTRAALNATVEANKITKKRDRKTSARESDRDRDTAARERERAADERFTSAIEQLGHPSASVRLGGMHSLHRLALGDAERLPTVVDVLCAYLRQPFHHPSHDWNPSEHAPDAQPPVRAWWPADQKERDERDSEREVRSTATRLIPTLFPPSAPPQDGGALRPPADGDAPRSLEINLNGAMLDGLDLSGRHTGSLSLDGAHITGDLTLGHGAHITGGLRLGHGAHITGGVMIHGGANITGGLRLCDGAHIGGLWLDGGAHITGGLRLDDGAHIHHSLWLGHGAHIDSLRLGPGAHIDGDLRLDDGAHIDGLRIGPGAHIGGNLVTAETAVVGEVSLHPKAAMDSDWFQG